MSVLLPRTAPFATDEIVSLERILAPATPTQRAWLSGFLAGLDSASAQPAVQPAAPPRAAEPLTIVFASESGNGEGLANDAAKLARKSGFKPGFSTWRSLTSPTSRRPGTSWWWLRPGARASLRDVRPPGTRP